ncbi:phosphopantetheine-binding protein [Kitasatospora terrestris]|uniref:Carrier domain-containing protein n=1 Tax=Kitasatospora terrestris TaxID=258051 RepID=A0ABP9DCK9_9ACTN
MSSDPPVDRTVIDAWCEALGVPTADLGDDFFASGGHSFAAVQLMTAVESALPITFPLETLFSDNLEAVIKECEARMPTD